MTRRSRACVVAAAVTLAVASLWRLWEQDIWWQVRAGAELLATLRLPTEDTWSYSARGGPWLNYQWLSTVILHLVERGGGVTGLIVLRGVIAAVLALLVARVALRHTSLGGALILVPLLWLACASRLQVRSDTFVLVVFAGVVDVWTGPASPRAKRLAGVAAVVLAANLHAGTAPFVLAAVVTFLASDWRGRRDLAWLAASLAAFFVTPYTTRVLPILWTHLFYARENLYQNPDHAPLSLARFDARRYGFSAPAWAVLVLAAAAARVAVRRHDGRLPDVWRRGFYAFILLVLLVVLSVNRERVVPYCALFALPPVAALVARIRRPLIFAGLTWLFVPLHVVVSPVRWGFGEDERIDPVVATRWLRAHAPQRNILHLMGEGNYLLGHTDYPVFVDTREMMYRDLQQTYLAMWNDPALMSRVVDEHDVHTVLVPHSFLRLPYGDAPRRAAFFPKRQWAIVHFDAGWVILVERVPAHAALIAREEYVYLVPYLAPDTYLTLSGRTPETDARFEGELRRCLGAQPANAFCRAAAAEWRSRRLSGAGSAP